MTGQKLIVFDVCDYDLDSVSGITRRAVEISRSLPREYVSLVVDSRGRMKGCNRVDDVIISLLRDTANRESKNAYEYVLRSADLVVMYDFAQPRSIEIVRDLGTPIIAEIAPPIEHLLYDADKAPRERIVQHQRHVETFNTLVHEAQYFLARSGIEKAVLAGVLVSAGRVDVIDGDTARFRDLIATVPVGYTVGEAGRTLRNHPEGDMTPPTIKPAVVWNGGLWPYMNWKIVLDAITHVDSSIREEFLVAFPDVRSREPDLGEGSVQRPNEVLEYARSIGVDKHVVLYRLRIDSCDQPTKDYDQILVSADENVHVHPRGYVCIGRDGIENETCVRLRVREPRAFGLPMIIDEGNPTSDELVRDGLAIPVDRESAKSVAAGLSQAWTVRNSIQRERLENYNYQKSNAPLVAAIEDLLARRDACGAMNDTAEGIG
ncbi:hypothetical protein [Rhodococcus sp. 2G]|uniref:hypothetical protein n=1 Tax=Rhodococcus sp. 2G TaxID=1570939 RepID=UPI000B1BE9F9|nr:hypothetical protein [Rhodococcus sp. 2G]